MRLGALEGFLQVFNSAPGISKWLLSYPIVQGPGVPRAYFRPRARLKIWRYACLRPLASINRPQIPRGDKANGLIEAVQIKQDGLGDFLQGPEKREPEAWVAVLDQYLPRSLRVSGQKSSHDPENTDPKSIEAVPSVLDSARQATKEDLLSYIGVYQERWEAVSWLVTAMLARCSPYTEMRRRTERLPTVLWDTNGPGLDKITHRRIDVARPRRTGARLDVLVGPHPLGTPDQVVAEDRQILGELWQSLGSMLMQIEDRSSGNPNRPLILDHVLQILAHMNHIGVLPDSIYNYDLTGNGSALRRPPTLHKWSLRILSVLSDISLKTYWARKMEKEEYDGYALRMPTVQPVLSRVGPEIWLELVLWACVEGGWISEAAWLVNEIQRRHDNPDRRWTAISWEQISSRKVQELGWIRGVKRETDLQPLNQATGRANRTSNFDPDMGTRTISSEVVLAIVDGLVNIVADSHLRGNTLAKIRNHLLSCQALLERGHLAMDSGHVNTLILRAMESSGIDTELQPGHLQMLLALTPKEAQSSPLSPSRSLLLSNSMLDISAPVLGLLHKLLNCYARQGNLKGSLESLSFIQEVIDNNRDIYIQDFADELTRRIIQGPQGIDSFEARQSQAPLMLHPEIPSHIVEAFLDLLVESKAFELGHWVLFNDEIDGGILNPNSFSDAAIQPALLRFATATANDDLLMKVLENLEPPLSEPVLHALLRCQVAVNRWDGVEGILKHFRDTDEMAWTPGDAMTIAAALPTLERSEGTRNVENSSQAKGILQALVQGEFNSPKNQAQIPDLQEVRTANQLGRIFQSVAGTLSTIKLGPRGHLGRANYSVTIPSDAFNILLGSVVQVHGSLAGIQLWERWCSEPVQLDGSHQEEIGFLDGDGTEKVVQPTISMLRLILRPATEELKTTLYPKLAVEKSPDQDLDQDGSYVEPSNAGGHARDSLITPKDSLSVFDWCVKMYRKFGLSEREIHREIPPFLGHIMEIQ